MDAHFQTLDFLLFGELIMVQTQRLMDRDVSKLIVNLIQDWYSSSLHGIEVVVLI